MTSDVGVMIRQIAGPYPPFAESHRLGRPVLDVPQAETRAGVLKHAVRWAPRRTHRQPFDA